MARIDLIFFSSLANVVLWIAPHLITRSVRLEHLYLGLTLFFPFFSAGHERSLTQIKFNAEGDLLFSCSKDHIINVWFSHNGERLGTYDGHNGTVWTIDVDCKPTPRIYIIPILHNDFIFPSTIKIHGLWICR